jgi:hypothetical protein
MIVVIAAVGKLAGVGRSILMHARLRFFGDGLVVLGFWVGNKIEFVGPKVSEDCLVGV